MSGTPSFPTACYVHVPFCVRKCAYCGFFSGIGDEKAQRDYLGGIEDEIECHRRAGRLEGRVFDTLHVGGGTPTVLEPALLEKLFAALRARLPFDPEAEVACEANPESLTPEVAALLANAGVNRLSIGAQSFHDDELATLGRPHDAAAVGQAVAAARSAGFVNIGLDLIYGLPGQTLERWQATVEKALALEPEHLSCYCLTLEPGTPLEAAVRQGSVPRPDEDRQREMFDWLVERLPRAGFEMYEISNFARPGRRSRHNLRYWTGQPWLGLGPAAHSSLDGRRAENPADLGAWRDLYRPPGLRDPFQPVARRDRIFERVFMALRLVEGLDLAAFEAEFGAPLESFYPGLVERLTAEGLLRTENGFLKVTSHARFLSDGVFCEFAS